MSDRALASVCCKLTGRLELIAARALGDLEDARDAAQETLARTVAALRDGRVPYDVPLEAFAHGVLRHVIADVLRQRARVPVSEDSAVVPSAEPSPLDAVVRVEERAALAIALAALPAGDRELLTLCFVNGERIAEIAARLGEPADRIRKRKSRALRRLRKQLGSNDGHDVTSFPTIAT